MTIHNIGDAKFGRDQVSANLNDGVEITRVNGPMPGSVGASYGLGANRAVGSHRQSLAEPKSDLTATNNTEFGGKFCCVSSQHQMLKFKHLNSPNRFIIFPNRQHIRTKSIGKSQRIGIGRTRHRIIQEIQLVFRATKE